MGYRLIISVSILSLLLTACFGAADGPNETAAGPDAAAGQPVKEQPELSVLPLTDSGLSMLVEDNTCFPRAGRGIWSRQMIVTVFRWN